NLIKDNKNNVTVVTANQPNSAIAKYEMNASGYIDTDAVGVIPRHPNGMDFVQNVVANQWTNDTGTGTTVNRLVKHGSTAATVVIATTSDTTGIFGICVAGCGTSGNAEIARFGLASCDFDGATTYKDWVIASTTTNGKCHDTGSTARPLTGDVIGRVQSTNGS